MQAYLTYYKYNTMQAKYKVKIQDYMLKEKMLSRALIYSLPGKVAMHLIDGIAQYSHTVKLKSKITSCKGLLDYMGVNPTNKDYSRMFTTLKKIGYIAKVNGGYVVNPLIDTAIVKRRHEVILEFYFTLFEGTEMAYTTVDNIKRRAVRLALIKSIEDKRAKDEGALTPELLELARAMDEGADTTLEEDELYNLAFGDPEGLSEAQKKRRKGIGEYYRNLATPLITDFIRKHVDILIEQGMVSSEDKLNYTFHPHSQKDLGAIVKYSDTLTFQDIEYKPVEVVYGSFEWYMSASIPDKLTWMKESIDNYMVSLEFDRRLAA